MLKCDGHADCVSAVTHIDSKGFAYCPAHAGEYNGYRHVRPMRRWEIDRLKQGGTILYERMSRAEFEAKIARMNAA